MPTMPRMPTIPKFKIPKLNLPQIKLPKGSITNFKKVSRNLTVGKAKTGLTKVGTGIGIGIKKAGKFCKDNPKTCAAGALGLGVGTFYGVKEWNKLTKEKKECLSVCYPDDWQEYKSGKIKTPTYKTKNAVSPFDNTVRYAALYPDMENQICTVENLTKKGLSSSSNNCKAYCENVCDFDITDVISGAVGSMKDDAQGAATGLLGASLTTMLGPNYKYYIMGIIGVLLLIVLFPFVMKLI
jgi:hypothetical protein